MPSGKILSRKDANLTFLDNVKERPNWTYILSGLVHRVFWEVLSPMDRAFIGKPIRVPRLCVRATYVQRTYVHR